MEYTEAQHKHNFAVWAGSRAAQRGFTRVEYLKVSLEKCGVVECAENNFVDMVSEEFDHKHVNWCQSICGYLNNLKIQKVSYGRAAKLIAVYLKSIIVMPDLRSPKAAFIHPPIDRILLQHLSKKDDLDNKTKKYLKNIKWTELKKNEYFTLIYELKKIIGDNPF